MDRAAAHGERQRSVGAQSSGRFAGGFFQWSGFRIVGEHLGDLESAHAQGCGNGAPDRNDRARVRCFAGKPGLGATLAHGAIWRIREQLAWEGSNVVDHRESKLVSRYGEGARDSFSSGSPVFRYLAWEGDRAAGGKQFFGD